MSRRRFLLAGGAAALGLAYPTLIEPRWLEVTHTGISLTPDSRGSIRLLHLSDLHASWIVPQSLIEAAFGLAVSEAPDLICLTGDFITFRTDFDRRRLVSALTRLAAFRPTFAVVGNHDGGSWAGGHRGNPNHAVVDRILEESGVALLHNRSVCLKVRGHNLRLVGVGDLWSNELDAQAAFRSVSAGEPTILLSHNPDSKSLVRPFPWNLMLCGHTHGGQVIIPFEGPAYAPVRDKRFVAGLREWDGRYVYVSRGVGNLGGVRFRCRPEVSVLEVGLA